MINRIKMFLCKHFYICCPKSVVQEPQPLKPEVKERIFKHNDDLYQVQTPFGQRTVERVKYPVRTQDTFNPIHRENRSTNTDIDYVTPMIVGSLVTQNMEVRRDDYGREERTNTTTSDDVSRSNVSVDTSYRSDPSPSYSPSVDSSPSYSSGSYDSGSSYSSSDSGSSYSSPSSDSGW